MLPRRKLKKTKSMDDFKIILKKVPAALSRKPAGLKATDFSVSAVRVYLENGSHKTLWYSSTGMCRDLTCKLQDKLKLKDKREQYKLQVRYVSGKIVTALDSDLVSNLVQDDVDKVFLVKSAISLPPTAPKGFHKKLVRALSAERLMDDAKPQSSEMENLQVQFSTSGKVRVKKHKQLLKAKQIWQSETDLVISLPLRPADASGNNCTTSLFCDSGLSETIEPECSSVEYFPGGRLRSTERRKSLSTGNISSLCYRTSAPTGMRAAAPLGRGTASDSIEGWNMDVDAMSTYLQASCSASTADSVAPDVPKRRSAFLENCTTDDGYLLKQGKRLSGVLSSQNTHWSQPIYDEVADVDHVQPNIPLYKDKALFYQSTPSFTKANSVPEPVYDTPCVLSQKSKASAVISAPKISDYKNRGIEVASCGRITFYGSELHAYDAPKIVCSGLDKVGGVEDMKSINQLVTGGTIQSCKDLSDQRMGNKSSLPAYPMTEERGFCGGYWTDTSNGIRGQWELNTVQIQSPQNSSTAPPNNPPPPPPSSPGHPCRPPFHNPPPLPPRPPTHCLPHPPSSTPRNPYLLPTEPPLPPPPSIPGNPYLSSPNPLHLPPRPYDNNPCSQSPMPAPLPPPRSLTNSCQFVTKHPPCPLSTISNPYLLSNLSPPLVHALSNPCLPSPNPPPLPTYPSTSSPKIPPTPPTTPSKSCPPPTKPPPPLLSTLSNPCLLSTKAPPLPPLLSTPSNPCLPSFKGQPLHPSLSKEKFSIVKENEWLWKANQPISSELLVKLTAIAKNTPDQQEDSD